MKRQLSIVIKIAFTLLLLLPRLKSSHVSESEKTSSQGIAATGIRCVIQDNDMYSAGGLTAGMNFEILSRLATGHALDLDVRAARSGESCLDSLRERKIDLVIMRTDSLMVPEQWVAGTISGNCHWIMRSDDIADFSLVSGFLKEFTGKKEYHELRSRFLTLYDPVKRQARGICSKTLCPYDKLIKSHAASLGWDWRMMVALIWAESRFSITACSHRGANGLMQISPITARHYNVDNLIDPNSSITAGTRLLLDLQKNFPEDLFEPKDRINFTLAAYNAGAERIADCRRLLQAQGEDPTKWENVAALIPTMTSYQVEIDGETYERSFYGRETLAYIEKIAEYYRMFCQICPEE